MAYYNGFPATYQPMYQQNYQPQNSGIIWVSGEAGAKAYLTAPNTTVQLWDSEAQRIYLKSADASGMPSIKTLEYTIVGGSNAPVGGSAPGGYATADDLKAVQSEINALRAEVEKLRGDEK